MSSAEAAIRYLERNIQVIPIPPHSKGPTDRKGWQNERWTAEDIPKAWTNGQNIGILTGEPSGGLCDVDKDRPEAQKVGGYLLQPSKTSGREGKPHGHSWYFVEGQLPETRKFQLPGDAPDRMVVELRSTGAQTLAPPSIYPGGDACVWGAGKIARISGGGLGTRCREHGTGSAPANALPGRWRPTRILDVRRRLPAQAARPRAGEGHCQRRHARRGRSRGPRPAAGGGDDQREAHKWRAGEGWAAAGEASARHMQDHARLDGLGRGPRRWPAASCYHQPPAETQGCRRAGRPVRSERATTPVRAQRPARPDRQRRGRRAHRARGRRGSAAPPHEPCRQLRADGPQRRGGTRLASRRHRKRRTRTGCAAVPSVDRGITGSVFQARRDACNPRRLRQDRPHLLRAGTQANGRSAGESIPRRRGESP